MQLALIRHDKIVLFSRQNTHHALTCAPDISPSISPTFGLL